MEARGGFGTWDGSMSCGWKKRYVEPWEVEKLQQVERESFAVPDNDMQVDPLLLTATAYQMQICHLGLEKCRHL